MSVETINPSRQASVLMKTFMMKFVNKNGQLVERRNLRWTNDAHCQSMAFTWIMRWYIYCTADVFSELRILLATMNILHDSYYINLINTQTKTKYSIIRYGCHGCKFQAIIVMPKIYRARALFEEELPSCSFGKTYPMWKILSILHDTFSRGRVCFRLDNAIWYQLHLTYVVT